MNIAIEPLLPEHLVKLTEWRAETRSFLRTPQVLTVEQQRERYQSVILPRTSPHWYFACVDYTIAIPKARMLVGVCGLTYISWENGSTELSLVLGPESMRRGIGRQVFNLLMVEAFNALRLETIIAECYEHNPALAFWQRMAEDYHALPPAYLPRRKWSDGKLHGSWLFTWAKP